MNQTRRLALTPEDVGILTRTIYGEARGEPYDGKKAVGHVALNRVARTDGQFRMDTTVAAACLRWLQFSCWSPGDPNAGLISRADAADPVFAECQRAALDALHEPDAVEGATHYHTAARPAGAATWPPAWTRGHKPTCAIGGHLFYAGIA